MFKPVELNSHLRSFFSHFSMVPLIRAGWDFESDELEYFDKHCDANAVAFNVKNNEGHMEPVMERELLLAGAGEDTPGLRKLMLAWERAMAKAGGIAPSAVLDVSMHSGSSDYLYAGDVTDYCEKVVALS
ncbi:hypothetical protein KAMAJI_00230 [Serratia phage vB_SmaM-Kamaji]|nr:hypothetical protein KAMAJI_00230 [Serratia phage vB_SmaM-Kamaji]